MRQNFFLLKEKANTNILVLFEYWGLTYTKINDDEYDFINPTRKDTNFGACRYNITKGLGADFAGTSFTEFDYLQVGLGFSREDFIGFQGGQSTNIGFDVIGLVQRLFTCSSYTDAAKLLNKQLSDIKSKVGLQEISLEQITKKQYEREQQSLKKISIAKRTWSICIPIQKTIGETYLNSRMIFLEQNEASLRYHPKVWNQELKTTCPALILKCSNSCTSTLRAIHRIYITPQGFKNSNLKNPKMVLGNIKGLGIWFSQEKQSSELSTIQSTILSSCTQTTKHTYQLPENSSLITTLAAGLATPQSCSINQQLKETTPQHNKYTTICIAEGPENALSIRSLGYELVVSTIDAANFANITIPDNIQEILLFPDSDQAGEIAAEKAYKAYNKIAKVKVLFPPNKNKSPKWDWNDEIRLLRGNNVK